MSSGKSKVNQQPVLAANVANILVELHQLAAANARIPAADKRASGEQVRAMVIRGK